MIGSGVSFLNFERFVLDFVILTGQSCQISARPLNFEFETENRCASKFVLAVG